ncbi:hypothetical protein ACAW74_13585 [Fibrella sp. WM1]|uniref:hypothetical protein n=1 Tax=Fibrella musci TaxID=3242485 RepID=UPI003521C75E
MKSFAYIGTLLLLSQCNPPCANELPRIRVDVSVTPGRRVERWQALGQREPFTVSGPVTGRQVLELPVDLNATATRYTVQIDGKPDTLTVRYAVQLSDPSDKCGYSLRLTRPTQELAAQRALGPVEAVYYDGDPLPPNLPVQYGQPGSVRVQLSL